MIQIYFVIGIEKDFYRLWFLLSTLANWCLHVTMLASSWNLVPVNISGPGLRRLLDPLAHNNGPILVLIVPILAPVNPIASNEQLMSLPRKNDTKIRISLVFFQKCSQFQEMEWNSLCSFWNICFTCENVFLLEAF